MAVFVMFLIAGLWSEASQFCWDKIVSGKVTKHIHPYTHVSSVSIKYNLPYRVPFCGHHEEVGHFACSQITQHQHSAALHHSPTSNNLHRSADTRNYATENCA